MTSARIGGTLVALYIVAAAATTFWAPGRLRPLFDGFGSHPGQYNWVNPPKEFAEGNERPDTAEANVTFGADGSDGAGVSTQDGQALVTLAQGSLPSRPPDSSAKIDVRPVDSARLGALPAGLRAEGNAYQVSIAYLSSQAAVTSLAKPGTVGLTAAAPANVLLFSVDGKRWQRKQSQPIPQGNGLTAALNDTGYYLAAAEAPARGAGGSTSGSGSSGTVVLVLAGATVPLVLAWLLLSRRRTVTAGSGRGASGRARPGTARGPRKDAGRPARAGGATGKAGKGKGRKGRKGPTPRRR